MEPCHKGRVEDVLVSVCQHDRGLISAGQRELHGGSHPSDRQVCGHSLDND